jgi:hypothetical protein
MVILVGATGLGTSVAVLVLVLAAGCSQAGSVAAPITEEDSGDGADVSYIYCPESIDSSYGSIAENLLMTNACTSICHITMGAAQNGDLDFTVDPAAIYRELLGPDGGGAPASNMVGTASVLRVDPFHPAESLLYIKLNLHSNINKLYGSGMPGNAPGALCPAAVEAVGSWIAQGALFGQVADSPDSGLAADGADADASSAHD